MTSLVLIGILASVFVLGAVGLLMFTDVVVAGPRGLHARRLPLMQGASLKAWAASRSRVATANWLATNPERTHAEDLARSVAADADHILDQAVFQESPEARGVRPCKPGTHVPQVTAPETFAIAAELRKLPLETRHDLKHHLALGVEWGSDKCPLLTMQGTCLCTCTRPLECRGRCLAGFDSSAEALEWANTFDQGMIEGLQQGLNTVGLDGQRYELNRALARVLANPALEEQWRRGELLLEPDLAMVPSTATAGKDSDPTVLGGDL
jgi:hypothetical protein